MKLKIFYFILLIIVISAITFPFLRLVNSYRSGKLVRKGLNEYSPEAKLNSFREAVKLNPENDEAFAYIAQVEYQFHNFDNALKNINNAVNLSPKNKNYYDARAKIKKALKYPDSDIKFDQDIVKILTLKEATGEETLLPKNTLQNDSMDNVVTWCASLLLPTILIIMFQYIVPSFQKDESITSFAIFYFIALTIIIFAYITLYRLSPHYSLTFIITILYGALMVHNITELVFLFKNFFKKNLNTFWVCKECNTENTSHHIQCWKCGYMKK